MPGENDGMEEALEGGVRVTLTAAGQVGEQLAVRMQNELARAKQRSEQEAAELAGCLHVERQAARAQLAPVADATWWDRAGAKEIAQAYATATAWGGIDPEVDRVAGRIRDEVRERYGADIDRPAYRDVFEARARERHASLEVIDDHQTPPWDRLTEDERQAAIDYEERRAMSPGNTDLLEAKLLMDMADRLDREAEESRAAADAAASDQREHGGEVGDDGRDLDNTAERRTALATDLTNRGIDEETVATRLRADASQARPATEATITPAGGSSKARGARWRTGRQLQRNGLDR